jgi:outer membrane lipoprotein-sorting protein
VWGCDINLVTVMSVFSLLRASIFMAGLCLLMGPASPVMAEGPQEEDAFAHNLLERSDEIRFPREGFQVDINIANSKPDQDTELRKYRVLSKGNENTVVMILEPASERGQIMLMKGRDLWVFMPNVSQPIRLGMAQRLTGEVANGDLARANFTGDYTPKILRSERLDGEEHYVLELLAVDRGVTYHRVLLWVNKTNYRPRKAEFYSLSNRLMKTCSYEQYRDMVGKRRPTRLVMQDALRPGEQSVLEYERMKLRDLPDKVFSKDYLKKLQ